MQPRYPVYYLTYVVADLLEERLRHDLERRFGSVLAPDVPAFLKQRYFSQGRRRPWLDKVESLLEAA